MLDMNAITLFQTDPSRLTHIKLNDMRRKAASRYKIRRKRLALTDTYDAAVGSNKDQIERQRCVAHPEGCVFWWIEWENHADAFRHELAKHKAARLLVCGTGDFKFIVVLAAFRSERNSLTLETDVRASGRSGRGR